MKPSIGSLTRLVRVRPHLPYVPRTYNTVPLRKLHDAKSTAVGPSDLRHDSRGHALGVSAVEIVDKGVRVFDSQDRRDDTISGLYLRDNCRCSSCVNQDTMQRNFNTFEIPPTIAPKEVRLTESGGIAVTWPDGHESEYSWHFIQDYLYPAQHWRQPDEKRKYFGSSISKDPPSVEYARVMHPDDSGVAVLTEKIRKHGFAFVDNTPSADPLDTKRLLERIAFIRVTHYGGFYDFTPDLSMADTAYTNLALPAHTDTTYFTDPAGLQAFHLLSHTPAPDAPDNPSPDPDGGRSLLVDGFGAVAQLKAEDPAAFRVLTSVRLPWHASGNEGIAVAPDRRYPVLEISSGRVYRVRWNNDDRGVVPYVKGRRPEEWYEAARKWDEILRRKENECWIQLVPGRVLVFDNWRVLHGRSAFTGIRRICGAYINRDDYVSRWRNTNLEREEVMRRVLT